FERVGRRNGDRNRAGVDRCGRRDRYRYGFGGLHGGRLLDRRGRSRLGTSRGDFDGSRRLCVGCGRCDRFRVLLERRFGDDGACCSDGNHGGRRLRAGRFGRDRGVGRHGLHGGLAMRGLLDDRAFVLALATTAAAAATAATTFLAVTRAGFGVRGCVGARQRGCRCLVGFRFCVAFAAGHGFERGRMLGRLAAFASFATFAAIRALAAARRVDRFPQLGSQSVLITS
ncbi:hypothetical protein K6W25_29035, partial [Burkholderia dolosa]|uniref:hypothetical protein n=1 Tax=Burkholderia dolosa TaxID=152500 RepID=UPI001C97AAA9